MITFSEAKWGLSDLLYILPLIILPTATILFFKRKKIGWTLLSIFLTYSAVGPVVLFLMTFNRQSSGITVLDDMLPETSAYLITLLFYGSCLWTICKEDIRDIYSVDKNKMLTTIGIVATVTAIITFIIFI